MISKNNKYTKINQREIGLSDMLFHILQSWRCILVSGIVFSIIFFLLGFVYVRRNENVSKKATKEVTMENLTDEELYEVNQVLEYDSRIAKLEKYYNESTKMSIDPYKTNKTIMTYLINSTLEGNIEPISDSYNYYIRDFLYMDELVEKIDWNKEEHYLRELISASFGTASESNNTSREKKLIKIYIIGENKDETIEIANAIDESIKKYSSQLVNKIGEHKIELLSLEHTLIYDDELEEKQYAVLDIIYNTKVSRDKITTKFTNNQNTVYSSIVNGKVNDIDDKKLEDDKSNNVRIELLILIGSILGIFLMSLFIAFKYIWTTKIQNIHDIEKMYNIEVLGNLVFDSKNPRIFGGIDRLINKLKNPYIRNGEQNKKILFTKIKRIISKNDMQKIVILSTSKKEASIDYFINELNQTVENVEVSFIGDIINSVDSYENVERTKRVILLELVNQTKYREIDEELKICNELDLIILGMVIISNER